jgi:hypothetical protein
MIISLVSSVERAKKTFRNRIDEYETIRCPTLAMTTWDKMRFCKYQRSEMRLAFVLGRKLKWWVIYLPYVSCSSVASNATCTTLPGLHNSPLFRGSSQPGDSAPILPAFVSERIHAYTDNLYSVYALSISKYHLLLTRPRRHHSVKERISGLGHCISA